MTMLSDEAGDGVREIPVEDYGSGVVKLITGAVSGVLSGKDVENGGVLGAIRRDLGSALRKVEAGLMGRKGP